MSEDHGPEIIQWVITGIVSLGALVMKFFFSKVKDNEERLEANIRKVDVMDERLSAVHEQTIQLNQGMDKIFTKIDDTNTALVDLRVSMASRRRHDDSDV
jgi:hypothetical protein